MKSMTTTLLVLMLAFVSASGAKAATFTLTATVTNEWNQPLDNADVVLVNPETKRVIHGKGNETKGEYVFEGLDSGEYILSVSSSDKSKLETEKVVLDKNPRKMKKAINMKEDKEPLATTTTAS
jgi:cellobiose-specific phosphotransferase system component IIB